MACAAWWLSGGVALATAVAQVPPAAPPPPPQVPQAGSSPPSRSGAALLGSPGIRTRYGDPSGPEATSPGLALPRVAPPKQPLRVPLDRGVEFAPTMEDGPFQRPTLRGLLRWDLQAPPAR